MESYAYNTFFTLDEARDLAQKTLEQCRARSMRTSQELCFSHGTRLQLAGMTATLNYKPNYDPNKLHVTVSGLKDCRILPKRNAIIGVMALTRR